MLKRFGAPVFFSLAAFLILVISIYKAAAVQYVFSKNINEIDYPDDIEISYQLPSVEMRQDNIFWSLQALKDKVWVDSSANNVIESERLLNLADNRLVNAKSFIKEGRFEEGVTALTKAEKYLEGSYDVLLNVDSSTSNYSDLFVTFVTATLKHREVIEGIMAEIPEDARPVVTRALDIPKLLYLQCEEQAKEDGIEIPKNPFEN